jgi:hypothetical protein
MMGGETARNNNKEYCIALHLVGCKVKVKLSHYRPTGFQEVKAPRFLDIGT